MKTKIFTIHLALFILMAQVATAKVCFEKGIYVTAQQDLPGFNEQTSIFSLPLERTYNSSAAVPGMFGLGWGTYYETTLNVTAHGVLVIQAGDSGRKSFYTLNKKALDNTGEQDMAPLEDDCSFPKPHGSSDSLAENREITKGDIFTWRHGCAHGSVQKEGDGYQRRQPGMAEFFDSKGRLSKISDDFGSSILIHRNGKGQITQIDDSKGRSLRFEYSVDGFVVGATREEEEVAYTYQGANLALAVTEDVKYQYTYNKEKRLIQTAANETVLDNITYDTKGRVIFLEDEGVSMTVLQYLDPNSTSLNPGFSHGLITTVYRGGQETWQDKNFYARTTNRYGISHLSRQLKENDLGRHETLFQECGLAVSHSAYSGKYVILNQYNEDCLLVEKNDGKKIKKLSYDKKHQKISQVTTTDIRTNQTTWTRFKYNAQGKLIHGKTSGGLETHLVYGPDHRIASMKDEKGQRLSFQYNDAGEPTVIEMSDVGRMDVYYDDYGKMTGVEVGNGKGHEIAIAVTNAFEKLLSIVKPAGVEMDF